MLSEEEKSLLLPKNGLINLPADNSANRLFSVVEFNSKFQETFKIGEFLQKINNDCFNGKGTICRNNKYYGLGVIDNKNVKTNRFDQYLSPNTSIKYGGENSYLQVENKDLLGAPDNIHWLRFKISSSLDVEENTFNIYVNGILTLKSKGNRSSNGNWNDGKSSAFLAYIGEGRTVTFPLGQSATIEDITSKLLDGVSGILQGFAVGGYMDLKKDDSNIKEDVVDQ